MGLFTSKNAIGVAIGQATVKGVSLSLKRRGAKVRSTALLDCQAEGIVGTAELYRSVSDWMDEHGWKKGELVFGIPQDLSTTQLADFPASSGRNMENMVRYETQQLSGLSDEPFIYDYSVLRPVYGRRNPVLIGVCKQSMIEEREDELAEVETYPSDFGMNGLAIANAYLDLYADATDPDGPQLLLDIGHTSTTLVILIKDSVYYCGSLVFGSERYTRALVDHLGVTEREAEETKRTSRLNPQDQDTPLYETTRILETELQNALDQWRSQERQELASKMFSRICLCGGGAGLTGLQEYFERSFGCETRTLGAPAGQGQDEWDPALVTAYGLALQGLGKDRNHISLATRAVRWRTARRHRVKFLNAALVCFGAALALTFAKWHANITTGLEQVQARTEELRRCQELIPELDKTRRGIRHQERLLFPFISKGTRVQRFAASLDVLSNVQASGGWLVYMADEASYRQTGMAATTGSHRENEDDERADAGGAFSPADVTGERDRSSDKPFPDIQPVKEIPRLQNLIVAGFVPFNQAEPYAPVRDIVNRLNKSKHLQGVDLLGDAMREERRDIFGPWMKLLNISDDQLYKSFMLKVPYATLPVTKFPAEKDEEIQ